MEISRFDDTDLAAAYAYPEEGPWLRANMVSSVDGAAWVDGRTAGLGSKADQRLLSLLRGLSDVVVAGANTVRVEGYTALRARPEWAEIRAGRPPVPSLAVISGALDLNFDSPLFTEADPRTIVITCEAASADRRAGAAKAADVIVAGDAAVDLDVALDELARRGLRRQLTEGGPRLLAQLAGRLDELCLTISPVLVGGDAGRILNGPRLPEAVRLDLRHVLDDDGQLFLSYVRGHAR